MINGRKKASLLSRYVLLRVFLINKKNTKRLHMTYSIQIFLFDRID